MKKVLSVILAVFIFCSANVYASGFSDISENHVWAVDAIDYLYDKMIISGYPDGTFRPHNNITNAEMSKLITLIFGVSENKGTYSDVSADSWYYNYAKNSKDYFIRENEFYPDEYSKRKEIAYAIYIASKMHLSDTEYSDELEADKKYGLAVSKVNEKGIIEGYPDGTLKPDNNVTRAEFAVMIKRVLDIDTDKTPVETPETEVEKKYTSHNYFFLVTEVSEALDENNEVCQKICGYNNGEYEELYLSDDVNSVLNLKVNVNNVLYIFKDYYGKPKDIFVYTGIGGLGDAGNLELRRFNNKNFIAYGEVTRINSGKSVELTASSGTGSGVAVSETYRLNEETNCYMFKDGEITESNCSKIRDSSYTKTKDYLLCHIEDDIVKSALIIRKTVQ